MATKRGTKLTKSIGASDRESLAAALKLRAQMKSKRPPFSRNQLYRHGVKFAKLEEKWRRPKGLQSKIRLRRRGAMPHPGYGAPSIVRGLHPSGLRERLVFNITGLDGADAKTEAIRIAGSVGKKKRLEILSKAKSQGLRVLNPIVRIEKKEKKVEAKEVKAEKIEDKKEARAEKKEAKSKGRGKEG